MTFSCPPFLHCVRMDRLSLPTGMERCPARAQLHAHGLYGFVQRGVFAGLAAGAIQLADSFTRGSSMGAASRLVMASATAMRPEAGR